MKSACLVLIAALLGACGDDVVPEPEGVDLPEGPCGHALYVLSSDYQSTSVGVVGWDGVVHAPSIVSSGSGDAGLSVALSGDVTAPNATTSRGELVLIDRYPAGVLTFFDPTVPGVRAQLTVQTGFASNPQDFLELDDDKAYVSRYDKNPDPGNEPFDEGSDVLVVDPRAPSIVARIDLAAAMEGAAEGILPRPSKMARAGSRVAVLLAAYSADFAKVDDGRVALLDPETDDVTSFVVLEGLRGCSTLASDPTGARLAVGCSGTFAGTSEPSLEDSGIAILAVDGDRLAIESVVAATDVGDAPIGFSIAFASETTLLAQTFGRLSNDGTQLDPDRLLEIAIEGEPSARELLSSVDKPFTIGEVRCGDACGACFVADAARSVIHRMPIEGGAVGTAEPIPLDDGIGLPPRYLGAY